MARATGRSTALAWTGRGACAPAMVRARAAGMTRFGPGRSPWLARAGLQRAWNPAGVRAKRRTSMPCCCATASVQLLLLQDAALRGWRLWDSHLRELEGGAHWQRHLRHSKGFTTAQLVI